MPVVASVFLKLLQRFYFFSRDFLSPDVWARFTHRITDGTPKNLLQVFENLRFPEANSSCSLIQILDALATAAVG